MMTRRSLLVWAAGAVAIVCALAGLYYAAVGLPTTPMTVAQADRLFGGGLQPGQSRQQVEAWLASQGIPPLGPGTRGTVYKAEDRPRAAGSPSDWMDSYDNRTAAECAGLPVDAVHSFICVTYPDAGRLPFAQSEVNVCLFFDADDRLIKHWAMEFVRSL
jgi:hypothetical protein